MEDGKNIAPQYTSQQKTQLLPIDGPKKASIEKLNTNRSIIISILSILIVFLVGIIGYLGYQYLQLRKQIDKNRVPGIEKGVEKSGPKKSNYIPERNFIVKRANIIEITDTGEEVVFENVENVENARLGPDGQTLHFKVKNRSISNQHCANLGGKVLSNPGMFPLDKSPAPTAPPWDYKRLGDAYTIPNCGENGLTGGFLKESNFFMFIESHNSQESYLIIENLLNSTTFSIVLDTDYLNDDNFMWIQSFSDQLGKYSYYYPHQDAKSSNNRVVVAFGSLVLTIDTVSQRLISVMSLIPPDYDIVSDSFWFHSNENLPIIIVKSGWEGSSRLQALIDLSGNNVKVIPLNIYDKGLLGFDIDIIEWKDNGVILNIYRSINLTEKTDIELFKLSPVELDNLAKQFKNQGGYLDVFCNLVAGGCFAISNSSLDRYEYSLGGNIIKL